MEEALIVRTVTCRFGFPKCIFVYKSMQSVGGERFISAFSWRRIPVPVEYTVQELLRTDDARGNFP